MPDDHDTKSDFENFHHPISWCSCLGDPCMLSSQLLLHRWEDLFFKKFEFIELVCFRLKHIFLTRGHTTYAWTHECLNEVYFFCIHVVDDEIKNVKLKIMHYVLPSSIWMNAIESFNKLWYNEHRMGFIKALVVPVVLLVHIHFFLQHTVNVLCLVEMIFQHVRWFYLYWNTIVPQNEMLLHVFTITWKQAC